MNMMGIFKRPFYEIFSLGQMGGWVIFFLLEYKFKVRDNLLLFARVAI